MSSLVSFSVGVCVVHAFQTRFQVQTDFGSAYSFLDVLNDVLDGACVDVSYFYPKLFSNQSARTGLAADVKSLTMPARPAAGIQVKDPVLKPVMFMATLPS